MITNQSQTDYLAMERPVSSVVAEIYIWKSMKQLPKIHQMF